MAEGDSKTEALAQAEKIFADMDTNGDGQLDRAELIAAAKAGAFPAGHDEAKLDEAIAQFDENGDGKISREEWLEFFGRMFDAVMGAMSEIMADAPVEDAHVEEAPAE